MIVGNWEEDHASRVRFFEWSSNGSAMGKIKGEACSMMSKPRHKKSLIADAHRDAEIFRVRFGKAIDYEYFAR